MWYQITIEPDYLRADLFRQETAEQAQEFLATVAAAVRRHGHSRIFIAVHASKPLFKVGQSKLLDHFKSLSELSRCRIALTGDSDELRLSHQYIESLARQRGINIRSFRDESAVLLSFRDQRWLPDRRRGLELREGQERRLQQDRRGKLREIFAVPG
jgi:hypothetical protein